MTTTHEQLVAEEMANLPKDIVYGDDEKSAAKISPEQLKRFQEIDAAEKAAASQEQEARFKKLQADEDAYYASQSINPLYGAGVGAVAAPLFAGGAKGAQDAQAARAAEAETFHTARETARARIEAETAREIADLSTPRPHSIDTYLDTQVRNGVMTQAERNSLKTMEQVQHFLKTRVTPAAIAGTNISPGTDFSLPPPGSRSSLMLPAEYHAPTQAVEDARVTQESADRIRARGARDLADRTAELRASRPPAPRVPGAVLRGAIEALPGNMAVRAGLGGVAGERLMEAYNKRESNTPEAIASFLAGLGHTGLASLRGKPRVLSGIAAGAGEFLKDRFNTAGQAKELKGSATELKNHFNDAAAERKAAGGSVQHFDRGSVVKKAGQELIGKGVDTLMPALKNSGLYFPKVQPQPASKVLDPYRNEYFGSTISDRLITRLGRSKEKGGARFSTLSTVDPAYAGSVWGSGNANAASGLANMQRDYPGIIIAPRVGTAEMHRSSTGVSDRVLRGFQKAVDQGLLPDDLRAAMNAKLAGHKKYVSQDGKPFFEPDIDVGAPDFANRLKTFEQRAAATETLGGEGVSRGRPDKGQIFDYDSIIRNTTEPGLLDVPVNSVGPRLFKLTGNYSYRPELNASYPYVHGGEDLGVEMMMTPHTALFPDKLTQMEAAIAAKIAAGTRKHPNIGSMDLSRNKLVQKMDPGFFHRLEDLGYNEGGEVGGLDALDRAYA